VFAAGILLLAATAWAPSVRAQCTLSGSPVLFEPRPPGVPRPATLNWIGINDFRFFQPPGGVAPRILVSESFGYQVVELTNPMNPVAIRYEDYRFEPSTPGPIPCNGDCHGSISSQAISDDGARVLFGLLSSQSSPYSTVVGVPDASYGFQLAGDMLPNNSSVAIQRIGGRYLAYSTDGINLWAADVTSPPGLGAPNNLHAERTVFPGGYQILAAGNNLVYRSGTSLVVIDASNPGPAGSISASFTQTTIAVGDWGRPAGETPSFFSAKTDPTDATKLYILAEFSDSLGKGAGYSLALVQGGAKTILGTFRIPALAGETWGRTASSGLLVSNGNVYALMWAKRTAPSTLYRLYSVAVAGWGSVAPGGFDVTTAGFAVTGVVQGFTGADGVLNTYTAGGNSGWAIPVRCVSPTSPPASDLVVQPATCPGGGTSCPLNPNDTVFVGTTLQIAPQVASARPITDWRLDLDFHPSEDFGVSPRIRAADLAYPAAVPASVTLVGPCDPRYGGNATTGTGCWASETADGDFAANAPAGTTAALTLALEAQNQNGWGNTRTFPLVWKIPAVRLQNVSVLLGQPVVSGSDGTPLSSGYKWYFGDSPTSLTLAPSCTGPSCVPPVPYNAKGTHSYWLTVPYPGGYTSPDCGTPCTQSLGTYAVTDVSLAFTGIPVTAVAGTSVGVTDASSVAPGVTTCTGGLQYAFCNASSGPCSASSWQSLPISPLGSGLSTTVPAPSSAGTYWLRIRYSYTTTGSCTSPLVANWAPGVSGVSDPTAWPLAVTPVPPSIRLLVNGVDPCIGAGGICSQGVPANVGDTIKVTAYLGFNPDSNPPPTTAWSFGAGASTAGCTGTGCQDFTFTYTAPGSPTVTLSGYPGIPDPAATKLMSVSVPPVSASNSTQPSGVCAGSSVTLRASPDVAGAVYAWSGPNGFTSNAQNPVIPTAPTAAAGTYTVVRSIGGQANSTGQTPVMLFAPPAVPTAGNNGPRCAGQTLSLTAATVSGATYAWTGPNGFTSTAQNPTIPNATPAASGTYVVTATVSGCSTAASTVATVNAVPGAPVAGNSGPLCAGGTLQLAASTVPGATYAWTGPNGFTSAAQNPTIPNATAAASGVYTVTASVGGCASPAGSTSATVNGASAAITAPPTLCFPNNVSGTASVANAGAGATYAWIIANGTILSGQGTPAIQFSPAAAGLTSIGVTVTVGGCASASSFDIPVAAQCGGLTTLDPCRVLDTRNPNGSLGGPPIGPNSGRRFYTTNTCGIPAGMSALSTNVTVISTNASGSIILYPGDLSSPPGVSTVSVVPGKTRANNAIVKLAADGSFWVWNATGGTVNVIVDVNGCFQ
jgi:hypothetical protein